MNLRKMPFLFPLLALATPAGALDDEMLNWENQAEAACKNYEFNSFFEAFLRSDKVRAKYSAGQVAKVRDGVSETVAGSAYRDFPLGMLEYSWVTADSVRKNEAGLPPPYEYVELEINVAGDRRARVDWVRMGYKNGSPDEGGEEDDRTGAYGKPGYLLFYPTDACWELVQDTQGGDAPGPMR
mgnify:CR=1 FL=1